jgi:hypothetical protein
MINIIDNNEMIENGYVKADEFTTKRVYKDGVGTISYSFQNNDFKQYPSGEVVTITTNENNKELKPGTYTGIPQIGKLVDNNGDVYKLNTVEVADSASGEIIVIRAHQSDDIDPVMYYNDEEPKSELAYLTRLLDEMGC